MENFLTCYRLCVVDCAFLYQMKCTLAHISIIVLYTVITDKDENVSHESQALGNVSGMQRSSESGLARHSVYTDTTPGVEERLWNVEQHLSFISGK